MKVTNLLTLTVALALPACSSYVNSPRAAAARAESAKSFSDPLIARAYNAKPAMKFPAKIAIAPVDEASRTQLRNMDAAGALEKLQSLPNISALMPLSTMLIGDNPESPDQKKAWNQSDLRLREAAARLHADAVLFLKVDTHLTDGEIFAPLTIASLGLFPNHHAKVMATTLGALVDTRTGYVYGTFERSAARSGIYSTTLDSNSRDRIGERAELEATKKAMAEFPRFWDGVVQAHRR